MKAPEFVFVDTAFGGPNKRNNPMRIQDVLGKLPEPPVDCHTTWRRFPQAYITYFDGNTKERDGKKYNSVGGYDGESYADYLPFDFDADELEDARLAAMAFLAILENDYQTNTTGGVRAWFSGSKGFHLGIPAAMFGGWKPSDELAGMQKALAKRIAGEAEIDDGVYDINRLFRIPNTINGKSGLYKIPLTVEELVSFPVDTIKAMATAPRRDVDWPAWDAADRCPALADLWNAAKKDAHKPKAKGKTTAVPASELFNADLSEGQGRDVQAFNVACRLRDWGVPPGGARAILDLWNANLDTPLTDTDGDDILEKKLANAYGDINTDDRITPDAVRSVRDLAGDYAAYVAHLKSRTVSLGFPTLDRYMRGIAPGEVCTIIAKTSVGKTAFIQNVLRNIAIGGEQNTLFCSMEQPKAQVFERWAQMVTDRTGREIEKEWGTLGEAITARMVSELGENLWTCDLPNLKMDELERLVWATRDKSGQNVDVVAIDYLGLLDARDLDRSLYGQISEAARQMKNFAKKADLAVVVLCQISRSMDDHGNKPLHLSSARESGAIEESADFMIGLYRPHIKEDDGEVDDEMHVQLLKNRKGGTGAIVCNFDKDTLTITERTTGLAGSNGQHGPEYQGALMAMTQP